MAADPPNESRARDRDALPPALRAEDISVVLGGAEVLRGVALTLRAGLILGVIGPSGAGKTTLFRVLSGELAPTTGTVWLGQTEVTGLPLWRRARAGLGYVPQTPSVLFDLTVRRNIRTFERMTGAPRLPATARAAEVGLEQRLEVRAAALSGGERRRLELLRALIPRPKVLICDEPLTGVDPAGVARIGALLRQMADEGTAIVLADHRIREALAICNEALLLIGGRVELVASPEHFADHEAVQRRYLN